MKLEKREFGTKSNSREQSAQPVKTPMDVEEHVRRRAYELYEERGKLMASKWKTGFRQKPNSRGPVAQQSRVN